MTVAVRSDTLDEIDETFTVRLSNPSNATITDGVGLGTITDDDAPSGLSVNDVTITEGNSGTVAATFTVSLDVPNGHEVTRVDYATADRSAAAGSDYVAASGELIFAGGETTKAVTVTVNGDLLEEVNETYVLDLFSPDNATVVDGQGLGTITKVE